MTLSIGLDFIGMGAFTPGSSGPYSAAIAGWSTRRVNPNYSGYAMQITNGSTTQDIGFSGDDLDEAAITSYLSGSTGKVTIWYDQFGNYDLPSNGALTGPRICSSGTVDKINGVPAPKMLNSETGYFKITSSNLLSGKTYYAFSTVAIVDSDASNNARVISFAANGSSDDYTNSTDMIPLFFQSSKLKHLRGGAAGQPEASFTLGTAFHALSYQNTSTYDLIKDGGTAITSSQSPAALATTCNFALGETAVGPETRLYGSIGEVIVWDTQLSSGALTDIYTDVKAYWGTP